jgi:hypothetical protein
MKPGQTPANPVPAAPKQSAGVRSYDALLDPLPQPDVSESDSDTAWGRWEDVIASDTASQDAEKEEAHPTFEDTVPAKFTDL